MSLISYKHDQDSIILRVKILDSAATTGAGKTGLTNVSSGLIISTIADNEATATAYTVAGSMVETIATLGTYAAPTATKCRFKEVDATNHKGVYEIQIADARFAVVSAKSILVSVSGATDAAECDALIPLTLTDPYSGDPFTRLGAPAGASVSADIAAIFTTAIAESYAADGATGTPAQILYLIQQAITEFAISSTTKTIKRLDGSTTAATETLDDATSPTSITRAT